MKEKQVQIQVAVNIKIKKPKMAQNSKFQMLVALRLNLNGGQFLKQLSKYGHFNNLLIKLKIVNFFFKNWTFVMES